VLLITYIEAAGIFERDEPLLVTVGVATTLVLQSILYITWTMCVLCQCSVRPDQYALKKASEDSL
jgi:hypothetical protein